MNLLNAYKYLYYRIYSWNLRTWGESDTPQINTLIGVSFLVYLNLITLLMGADLLTGFHILEQIKFNKVQAIVSIVVIGLINYYIFLHKSKYKLIVKQFNEESKIESNLKFIWCLVYVIFSFISFFVTLLIFLPSSSQ